MPMPFNTKAAIYEGYTKLGLYIVIKCISDWFAYKRTKEHLERQHVDPEDVKMRNAEAGIAHSERFFLSDWFNVLTEGNINGELLIEKLHENWDKGIRKFNVQALEEKFDEESEV